MALYTTDLAPETLREKARIEIEKAKRRASMQRERREAKFHKETSRPTPEPAMDPKVLASLTRAELYEHAKQVGVRGRSKMKKAELVEAVRHAW